ncbi:MAG: carbohydrate ABC transporter permease [Aggregatilineales bacterium]
MFSSGVKGRWVAFVFVLPVLALLLSVSIYPLLRTLGLAFSSLELTVSPVETFVGLDNFAKAFNDARFWNAMGNTLTLVTVGVAIQLVLGTALATLLSEIGFTRVVWLTALLLPVMIAPVVSGFQFRVIYNDTFGPLNYLIKTLSGGLLTGPPWLADTRTALFTIMMTDVWQWTPFMMLLVLAGLESIPVELTEAAEVDGAGYWGTFWRIKLPLLLPVIVIGLLIRMMDTFKTFDLVFLLTGGGPGSSTETIAFYTYLNGFRFFSMGYTAAIAFIQLIIIVVIARVFLVVQKQMRGDTAHL